MIDAKLATKSMRAMISNGLLWVVNPTTGKWYSKTAADDKAKEDTVKDEIQVEKMKNNVEYLLWLAGSRQECMQMVRITVVKTDVSPRADMASI